MRISPISRIALRRIKRDSTKSILLMIAIFFSVWILSFLLLFEVKILPIQEELYKGLPFQEFLAKCRGGINISVAFLILMTILTIRVHCGIRNEENAQTLAVLTSIGAVKGQIKKLIFVEIMILYLPSTVLGVVAGILPCMIMETAFSGEKSLTPSAYMQYMVAAVVMIEAGGLLVILCNLFPMRRRRRDSVIGKVKNQNVKAVQQRHSYRQSRTFRSQALVKRLAKKSVDYYSKIYNNIALSFASAAQYPIYQYCCFGTRVIRMFNLKPIEMNLL